MNYHDEYEYLGPCPICERDMFNAGRSVNRHHFVPKSRGGKEQEYCHRVCHDMLHRTWTEKELEEEFSDPDAIRQDPRIQDFLEWVRKKDPLFYIRSANRRDKGSRRRR